MRAVCRWSPKYGIGYPPWSVPWLGATARATARGGEPPAEANSRLCRFDTLSCLSESAMALPGIGHSMTVTDAGTNPALRVVLSLPACSDGSELASWIPAALAPYVDLPLSPLTLVPLADAIRDTPILRDIAPPTCVAAGRMGAAVGWEARDLSRRLVARAVSVVAPGRNVPERMVARTHAYHQERIGSGQALSGFIDGDRLEAIIDHRIVVLELPGVVVESYDAGVEVEARLLLADLAPLAPSKAFELPTALPPGLHRCTAPVWVGRPTVATEYCDGAGRSIIVAQEPLGERPAGTPVAVGGLAAVLEDRPGGAHRITLVHPRDPGMAVWAEATSGIEVDQLVATLESIPSLERRVLEPRSGTGDLRPSFSEAWLRSKLEAIGAHINSIDARHTGGMPFLYVTFTVDGQQLLGVFAAQAPLPLPLGTGVVTAGAVDLYVIEDRQAYGYCSNIFLNVRDPLAGRPGAADVSGPSPAVDAAVALACEMGS